jgi:hypothetical protein
MDPLNCHVKPNQDQISGFLEVETVFWRLNSLLFWKIRSIVKLDPPCYKIFSHTHVSFSSLNKLCRTSHQSDEKSANMIQLLQNWGSFLKCSELPKSCIYPHPTEYKNVFPRQTVNGGGNCGWHWHLYDTQEYLWYQHSKNYFTETEYCNLGLNFATRERVKDWIIQDSEII